MMYWLNDQEYDDDAILIERSECGDDDDDILIKRSEDDDDDSVRELKYDDGADHDVTDQNMMMLLIKRKKCWRSCCWSKDQSTKDVAVQNAEDVFTDRKIKVLKMLLIKMMKILLLIERSKC